MILQQPFHPIVGAAPFLISRESHDDVSIRLESLLLILNEIGDPNGGLRLIVTGAAAVVEAVLFDELKRIHAPVFALGFYRSEEHTSELQSRGHLVCRLLLEKKKLRLNFGMLIAQTRLGFTIFPLV